MIKVVFMGKPALSGNFTHFKYLRDNLTNCQFYLLGLGKATDIRERDVDFVQIGQEFDRVRHKKQLSALLIEFCDEREIDILIPMNSGIAISCMPFMKKTKVIQIVNTDKPRVYKAILSHLRFASKIITISERQVDVVREHILNHGMLEKLVLIPHGVFAKNRELPNVSNKALVIGFVGRLEHASKGVLHIPEILKPLNFEFYFEIIGDGEDKNKFISKLSQYKIPFNFHGYLPSERIYEYTQSWDIFLFPSQYEGFGLTLIEAMNSGAVPLANYLPGITDFIITSGKDGFVIRKNKIKDFVSRIEQLNEDRDLLYRMKQAARETIMEKFELSAIIRQYQQVFEEVLRMEKPVRIKDFSEWKPYVDYKPSISERIKNRINIFLNLK